MTINIVNVVLSQYNLQNVTVESDMVGLTDDETLMDYLWPRAAIHSSGKFLVKS